MTLFHAKFSCHFLRDKMAEDVEGFESCLSEVLLKLSESGPSFTLKREQELAMVKM